MRAIHYYIGDEVESNSHDGEIRAIVSEILQTLVTCVAFYLILEQMRQFSQCSLQDVETTQVKHRHAFMMLKGVLSQLKQ